MAWSGWRSQTMPGSLIRHSPAPRGIDDDVRMCVVVLNEQAGKTPNDPPVIGSWNLRHLDDSPGQFVEMAFLELGRHELLER